MNQDELWTTKEVALHLGVGTTAIKRWADQGVLRCVKTLGGHRRFLRAEVERFARVALAQGESAEEAVNVLLSANDHRVVTALLLSERAKRGAWFRVAGFLGEVLELLGRRWANGEISVLQEHVASEHVSRALVGVRELIPRFETGERALMVCVEGDEHTLGLELAELCAIEAGWQTVWAGRNTPVDQVIAAIKEGRVELVVGTASSALLNAKVMGGWLENVGAVAFESNVPLVLGGKGAWPEHPKYGVRLEDFEAFHEFLVNHLEEDE